VWAGERGEGRGEEGGGDVPWLVCVAVEDAKVDAAEGSEVEIVGSFA
jgi:hypothetical protein